MSQIPSNNISCGLPDSVYNIFYWDLFPTYVLFSVKQLISDGIFNTSEKTVESAQVVNIFIDNYVNELLHYLVTY